MAEFYDDDTLCGLVAPHLDIEPEALRFERVTTGKHNDSYWIHVAGNAPSNEGAASQSGVRQSGARHPGARQNGACPGGARYIIRIAPPDDVGMLFYEQQMMRQEPELHRLIEAETEVPVASVLAHDFSRTRIDRDYLIMSVLPGTPMSDFRRLTARIHSRALFQVGQHLADLHALIADECLGRRAYGYLGAHRPMEPQSTWWQAFRLMWNKLLDDVVACGAYTVEEGQVLRDLLDTHARHFEREVRPCLLHMDIWSQNILLDDEGNVTGLVDFDRALWGDVEIEYAVLDYCGISEPAFWQGYGSERDDSPAARVRQLFYLLYELQKYMPIHVWRRDDRAGSERYKRQALSLAADLMGS